MIDEGSAAPRIKPSTFIISLCLVVTLVLFALTCSTYRKYEFDRPLDFNNPGDGFTARGGWARQNDALRFFATIVCCIMCLLAYVVQWRRLALSFFVLAGGFAVVAILFFAAVVMDASRVHEMGSRLCPVAAKLSTAYNFTCIRGVYVATCVFDAVCLLVSAMTVAALVFEGTTSTTTKSDEAPAVKSPQPIPLLAMPRGGTSAEEDEDSATYVQELGSQRDGVGLELSSLSGQRGVNIEDVTPGGVGEAAGLVPGETILSIDGIPTNSKDAVYAATVADTNKAHHRFVMWRNGSERTVLVSRKNMNPPKRPHAASPEDTQRRQRLDEEERRRAQQKLAKEGALVDEARRVMLSAMAPGSTCGPSMGMLLRHEARGNRSSCVVVHEVNKDGTAHEAGIQVNDIILKVGDLLVSTVEEFAEALTGVFPGQVVEFCVRRGAQKYDIDVTFGMNGKTLQEVLELRAQAGEDWCALLESNLPRSK